MGNFFGYKRISTAEDKDDEENQKKTKQSFGRQTKALEKYAVDHGVEYMVVFTEEKSGKNFEDRPQIQKLESILHAGDTVVFKDLSRFTREAENGYSKYMAWLGRGINMVFIDNPTVSSDYIRQMMAISQEQDIVTKTALEGTIKLMLIVELDRAEKQREYIVKAIKDGIAASNKKSGRPMGKLDKCTPELKNDILKYLNDRTIKQTDLINKHNVTRNTLKKYIAITQNEIAK